MVLAELVRGLNITKAEGDLETQIKGVAVDSRNVEKGFLFVCIDGTSTDGHEYVKEALERGAAALVAQKEMELPQGVPLIKTENTREALAVVSDRFYGHPSGRFRLIGITGTKGKTTVSYMIREILERAGRKIGLIGTLGTRIGNAIIPSVRTTPESLDLQRLFSQMASEGVGDVVMEVSSQGLAMHRVDGCEFDIGVFTNLSRDHISEKEHHSMEEYLLAKCRLFQLSRQGLINLDSEVAGRVLEEAGKMNKEAGGGVLTFGMSERCDVKALDIKYSRHGASFVIESPWYGGRLTVNIPGRFSVYNALAAAGVCGMLGIGQQAVEEGLAAVQVPGRAETVYTGCDFSVIIDYAHTPDSLENILSTLKEYAAGRVICVFGCGGDRDRTKRPMMGAVSARLADFTVITSDNPRTEDPEAIIRQIEEGIRKAENAADNVPATAYTCITDRREAIRYALSIAGTGDVIVLAGKGHETYQIFKDRTIRFDERVVVQELLSEQARHIRNTGE